MRIGVLALQGDFAEHGKTLERLGAEVVEVRLPGDLEGLDGLVIPGGESTTIGKLLVDYGMLEPLRERIRAGLPTLGTCAGAIVLAKDVGGLGQPLVGAMDLKVKRNAFGRQLQSFEADLPMAALGDRPVRAIFIRAPAIESVGHGAEVLARLEDGTVVAARQGKLVATAFHPELTDDDRFHAYWLSLFR
ncbi:MAG TPA: pyridoxal 5'-phosphate synthase glutaminase subunit PdxT [Chloroflexota bacterium]|nr:pyridoxal 5'-phosphate synthase glutaminase subunit PdxT [Chloroflexota bacterium]